MTEVTQVVDQTVITQTWMLGIFGFVIVTLLSLIGYFIKQAFSDSKEALIGIRKILDKHEEELQDHETRIRLEEKSTGTFEKALEALIKAKSLNA